MSNDQHFHIPMIDSINSLPEKLQERLGETAGNPSALQIYPRLLHLLPRRRSLYTHLAPKPNSPGQILCHCPFRHVQRKRRGPGSEINLAVEYYIPPTSVLSSAPSILAHPNPLPLLAHPLAVGGVRMRPSDANRPYTTRTAPRPATGGLMTHWQSHCSERSGGLGNGPHPATCGRQPPTTGQGEDERLRDWSLRPYPLASVRMSRESFFSASNIPNTRPPPLQARAGAVQQHQR